LRSTAPDTAPDTAMFAVSAMTVPRSTTALITSRRCFAARGDVGLRRRRGIGRGASRPRAFTHRPTLSPETGQSRPERYLACSSEPTRRYRPPPSLAPAARSVANF
jgi:hypothetical protein